MAIVIGAGTSASIGGVTCVASVNWGANPNTQRLYCLGSWTPEYEIERPTENMNMTVYSPGPTYGTTPSVSCADADQISAMVSPVVCPAGAVPGMSGNWFVTSYSYSKDDAQLPGQESWAMTRWVGPTPPDYTLRGIAEGSGTPNAGIVFTGSTTESTTGNVAAGGIGRADTLTMGTVIQVGGGASASGETGTGSVSIPYTPLWIT